ncbi:hypothetical protein ACQJBY_024568 [Aegilops geniculata]
MERRKMAQVATYVAVALAAFLFWQSTRSPAPTPTPPPPPSPGASVFPRAESAVLPDPARFFAPHLLAAPLPTGSFFQNFALNDGDQPEYIHPYLVKSAAAGLTVCYPKSVHSPSFHAQAFVADLTVSSPSDAAAGAGWRHSIAAFDDLSVTLDFSRSLRAFLVRGSPFVTVSTMCARRPVDISIASVHAFLEAAPRDDSLTRWRLRMNSGQTFLLYASAPIRLSMSSVTRLAALGFLGVIRVAFLPDAAMEAVLDRYSGRYPTAGVAALDRPFSVDYAWCTQGSGDLLMLAHPLHLRLLSKDRRVRVLEDFRYRSIDGDLVGVVGDSWALRTDPVFPTWHSIRGVSEDGVPEIAAALRKDVDELASSPITTTSSYFYGKAVARAARLALIAEEVGCPDVIPAVHRFLNATVTPWLDGSFEGNGFLYDPKWGGLVTRQGMTDTGADFGFGIYNDHHYHLGYFVYAIAVLAKIDPAWGREYMPQACSMVADFMTLQQRGGRELPEAEDVRSLEAALLGRRPDGVRRRAQPGEHQRGRQRLLLRRAPRAQLRGQTPRLRRGHAHRARDAGGADMVAHPGGRRDLRGRLHRQQPRRRRRVGEQEGQRPLVRAAGVEGVQAGHPAPADRAYQRGPLPGRRVRQGAGELDRAGVGQGRRRRRVEGVRVRLGGGLRQGVGAGQDEGAGVARRRQHADQPAVVAPQPRLAGRRRCCRWYRRCGRR